MSLQTDTPTTNTQSAATSGAAATQISDKAFRRSRWPVVILMIGSLAGSTLLQQYAFDRRTAAVNYFLPEGTPLPPPAANLDSYSLALLLGGLRGPLVMYLWSSSENQKTERDLDSFESKVEMIRLLQPEFDTVIIFQIWNLAYNISAQMASLPAKYACILDALQFGFRADKGNPYSINITTYIGNVFSEKLGNASEKDYYRRRIRTESLPVYVVLFPAAMKDELLKALADSGTDPAKMRISEEGAKLRIVLDKFAGDRVAAKLGDRASAVQMTPRSRQDLRPPVKGRPNEFDTLLTADGMILPELLKPKRTVPEGQEGNDGSELQYLAKFQPFKYGVSPIALGYNYVKKGQVLQTVGKQRHLQWSELVVDNQPGLTLKQWAEEEADRGRKLELKGMETLPDTEKLPLESRAAGLKPGAKIVDRFAVDEAIFSLERCTQVCAASLQEYERHLKNYSRTLQNYQLHTDHLRALGEVTAADACYLRALATSSESERSGLLAGAKQHYEKAERWYRVILLKYHVMDVDAEACGFSRATVDQKELGEVRQISERMAQLIAKKYKGEAGAPYSVDRVEYLQSLARIEARLRLIK